MVEVPFVVVFEGGAPGDAFVEGPVGGGRAERGPVGGAVG